MAEALELLQLLRDLRSSLAQAAQGEPEAGALDRLEGLMARLDQGLEQGLPVLSGPDAAETASLLEQLMKDSSYLLKRSQLRAQWSRLGAPLPPKGPSAARLDLVS